MPSRYAAKIIEITKCSPEEADETEEVMRATFGTLDWMSSAKFRSEAKACLEAARELATM